LWMGVIASVAVGASLLALSQAQGVGSALAAWGCLNLVAALGVSLRTTWGFVLEALLGVAICALTGGGIALFGVLLLASEHGSLDDPMFGTGIVGVLNGWASLALFCLIFAAGVIMIATAWRGINPEVGASRRGWTVLGGLFLLGAAPLVLIWVTLENSQGHLAENVVETLVLISAALAIGGIALIAGAAFGWAFRDRGG